MSSWSSSSYGSSRRLLLVAFSTGLGILAGCAAGSRPPPVEPGANPFAGRPLRWVESTNATRQAEAWRRDQPDDAAYMELLAEQPVALWYGDWTPSVEEAIRGVTFETRRRGELALMVLYNIPNRDCGQYSAGGVDDPETYRRWIRQAKRGIGRGAAAVILEPDALGLLEDCLNPAKQRERLELLSDAVQVLSEGGGVAVYIDAGNARWHPPEEMARRLRKAGIEHARGFALNVSNYVGTEETVAYGKAISALVGDKPFVVDTSRNGNGPTEDLKWCNPRGRAVGRPPTSETGDPSVDAFLWIKVPGESDGACNGGPAAGAWWPEVALELARNGTWTNAALGRQPPRPEPEAKPEDDARLESAPPNAPQPSPGPRR
ncbi:glycoside hydrolase family 6 protein [Paraliomyxa miuraensis]|uniref:glycoside hydrolase family 6 protein n=1 Tax=Paraliomyxa miuraensis TaxID=376150 RepID=UPI00224F756C|nr:glycoside hydrolase family 6 protein [Paraliomyxa miuraensis]MCX4246846.1 glycoside hydrolase family 6 protein [Paraliomyxa miuraensis]